MGQYYICLTENKDGKRAWDIQIIKPKNITREMKEYWSYYNGVKLMEHSWVGNSFMMAISNYIYKNPTRVAWVGDYADDFQWDYSERDRKPDPKKLHNLAWGGLEKREIAPVKFDLSDKFLVNHTTKEAIDFNQYIENCTKDGWCIHPLSLLTACGNGLGGGDFWHKYCGAWMVGAWCNDVISIEDECPEDCEIIDVEFMEE